MEEWAYNKRVRELVQNIKNYELHAKKEIENNKIARPDKVRDNSQRYLQVCLKRYKDFTGKDYYNK